MTWMRWTAFALASAVMTMSACSSKDTEVPKSIPCSSAADDTTTERAADVHVVVDDALPEQVRADLRTYLATLWSTPIDVTTGAPPAIGDILVISLDAGVDGYALARDDDGARKRLRVTAATREDLVTGTYAMLEELRMRFFHPMQEYVPIYAGPRFPRAPSVHRRAA